jgi:hypothetical protein
MGESSSTVCESKMSWRVRRVLRYLACDAGVVFSISSAIWTLRRCEQSCRMLRSRRRRFAEGAKCEHRCQLHSRAPILGLGPLVWVYDFVAYVSKFDDGLFPANLDASGETPW